MRKFVALAMLFAAPLMAQTPDSTKTDSIAQTVYSKTIRLYFTRVDTVKKVDTVTAPAPTDTTPTPPPVSLGKPYGPSGILHDNGPWGAFNYDPNAFAARPTYLLSAITKARQKGVKLFAALPCGPHSLTNLGACLKDSAGVITFDRQAYDSLLQLFNTKQVKDSVAKAVADGVLLGINLMDEPWVHATGDGAGGGQGNTWGPKGLTKATVDQLCAEAKAIFPNVPVGTSTNVDVWEPTNGFKICDLGIEQLGWSKAKIYTDSMFVARRDAALALAKKFGYSVVFSYNDINGGSRDPDTTWDCKDQGGIKGQNAPLCQMTPRQIIFAGDKLGDLGCAGLMMWRNDSTRFAGSVFQDAFKKAAALQATRAQKPCPRR